MLDSYITRIRCHFVGLSITERRFGASIAFGKHFVNLHDRPMVPMFRNHAELTGVCCELVTDSQREAGRSYTAASA